MVTAEEVAQVALFAAPGSRAARAAVTRRGRHRARSRRVRRRPGQRARAVRGARRQDRAGPACRRHRSGGRRPPSAARSSARCPIALGTVFPVGFRAAEPSRVMRIDPHDYHAIAATAPHLAQEVGRLAAHRMSGLRGLQGLAAEPPPPRAIVVGQRWDAAVHGPPALPRPQPGHVSLDHAGRSELGRPLGRPAPTGGRPSDDPRDRRQDGGPPPAAPCGGAPRAGDRGGGAGVRHGDRRRRTRRSGCGGLRRLRGAPHHGGGTAGPGRSGRDLLADRELPRLPLRRVGRRARQPSAAAGTPARRGDPRHARDRAHRPRDAPGPSRRRRRHPSAHDHPRVRRRLAEARDRRLRPPRREGDLLRRGPQRGAEHARPGHPHRGRGQLGGPGRALLLEPRPERHHPVPRIDGREEHVALPHRPARGAREHPHPRSTAR